MTNETQTSKPKFVYPKIDNFVKPEDFKDKKKLSGRILNAITNIPNQIYRDDAEDEWVSNISSNS